MLVHEVDLDETVLAQGKDGSGVYGTEHCYKELEGDIPLLS